jgi:hypothetical protein
LTQKEKNYEVNLHNVVENLSKVGMNLEKRLSYIYTKNKLIKDENILLRCVYNQQYKEMEDMFVSPEFLGLNQADISSDDEEYADEKNDFRRDVNDDSH